MLTDNAVSNWKRFAEVFKLKTKVTFYDDHSIKDFISFNLSNSGFQQTMKASNGDLFAHMYISAHIKTGIV